MDSAAGPRRDLEASKGPRVREPGDLFTQHLVGSEHILELLGLFGCEYRECRTTSAPNLRVAPGTSKGELLCIQDGVVWDGQTFPHAKVEYKDLPDAHERGRGLLPHLHGDLQKRFPGIYCGDESGLEDLATDDTLELKGYELGKQLRAKAVLGEATTQKNGPKFRKQPLADSTV